ncbi:hypothetical protein EDB81DRAFT_130843 [Dactylonectria macrodidyma]|uniref:C2H2-type domain-containing protein n=1 Tax=Dactylonectria macrodidyma TaxID=307937 RepID=A0A9P9E5P4_9HYPO|nr:hypothetical protein EDB81DRAFT_130843 [Dactylonectria macrodidyma]
MLTVVDCTHEDSVSAIPNGSTTLKQHIQNAVSDAISNATVFDQLDLVHMQQFINSAVQDGIHTFRERGSYGYAPTTTNAQRQQTQPVIDINDLMPNTQDFALVNSTECGRSSPEVGIGKRKENDPRGQTSNSNNEYVDGTHNDSKDEHDVRPPRRTRGKNGVWPPRRIRKEHDVRPPRHIEEERQPDKLWACPFYKLDPHRHYQCLKYKLKRFADLRQHITRVHVIKDYYCQDCWAHFKRKDNLDSHIRNGDCRGVKEREKITIDNPILHGLFPKEVTPLHVISRHGNETDKWYRIWDTLFREHLRPASPFVMEGIAEPMALLAHHGETELQAQLPALLQGCDQTDQQSVLRLGKEITRIFSNSSPLVSRPTFRKLPNQDDDKGTVGAGDKRADPIEMPSSIINEILFPSHNDIQVSGNSPNVSSLAYFEEATTSDIAPNPCFNNDPLQERSIFLSTNDDYNAVIWDEFSGDVGLFP